MQIHILARGFSLTEGLRDRAHSRLESALGWAHWHLGWVTVRLSDENGPRGGRDKCCRIRVGLRGAREVLIEDREDDLYVAIDHAAERASRAVARRLKRLRELRPGVAVQAEPLPAA